MLNSFTNFLHASALATYTILIYAGFQSGKEFYTLTILLVFLFTFILKVFGVLAHLPYIDGRVVLRNTVWICIALGVVVLNLVTLYAIHAHPAIIALGGVVTIGCVGLFFFILRRRVRYAPIAIALIFTYLLAALVTCGALQIGFLFIVLSNIVWVLLARVPYLFNNAYHNDIYHLALIFSTFWLYHTVTLGLWQLGACG